MPTPDEKMIDVTEDFSCPHQTEAYLAAYREWRRRKKNRYAFRFSKNPRESAFSENQSVVEESPAQAEKAVLRRLGALLGCMLVCCLTIENILDKVLAFVLNHMGFSVGLVYWGEFRMFGDEQIIFWIAAVVYFLKFVVPALILFAVLRMPACVCVPMRLKSLPHLLAGIMLMMFLSMGCGTLLVSRSDEMEKYQLISDAFSNDDNRLVLYILFTVFLVPLLMELLVHGCMFQVLRQFGELSAIVLTTGLAALLTHNVQDAVRIGLVTLLISCFMIRTGSFLTAVLLHIVHEIYMFGLFYTETFGTSHLIIWWFLVPGLMGVLAVVYLWTDRKRHPEKLFRNKTYLGVREQMNAFFSAMPMLVFSVSCVLLMVMTAILE